jgi:hypothetical protein
MKLSLNFMHWVDKYVGSVLMTLLQPFNLRHYLSKPPDVKQVRPRRILIINPGGSFNRLRTGDWGVLSF